MNISGGLPVLGRTMWNASVCPLWVSSGYVNITVFAVLGSALKSLSTTGRTCLTVVEVLE